MRRIILIGGGAIVLFGAAALALVSHFSSSHPAPAVEAQSAGQAPGSAESGAPGALPSQASTATQAQPSGAPASASDLAHAVIIPPQALDRAAETELIRNRNAERKLRNERRAAAAAAAGSEQLGGNGAGAPVRQGSRSND